MPTNREARQWTAALDSDLRRKIAADRRLAVARYLAAKAAKELSIKRLTIPKQGA